MTWRSPPYPLFQPKTLTKRIGTFGFPSDLQERISKIQKWIRYSQSGSQTNEATDAEFINDIFVDVLGYKSPFQTNNQIWELEYEPQSSLGFFTSDSTHIIAEIYLGEINSKVEAQHATTEWLIVADYQKIRLYHKSKPILFYQQFLLDLLVEDFEYLKQFYFVFCRRTLLTGTPNSQDPSRILQLLKESEQIEAAIAKDFYAQYHKIRLQLVKDFQYRLQQLPEFHLDNHTEASINQINQSAIFQAQKLLNRILFIAFCEDRNLLPDLLLNNAYEFYNPYFNQPVWDNYKAIFSWIFLGSAKIGQSIPKYGSDLFAPDPLLDKFLFVGDELCRQIKDLTRFDFNEEISHTILIYIFEESVKDLALLFSDPNEHLTKRRKFRYPPKSLSSCASVCKTLQDHLNKKAEELAFLDRDNPQDVLNYWQARKQHLLDLSIVDPQCGAGAFLATAFDFLLYAYEQVDRSISKAVSHLDDRSGLDLNILPKSLPETIEIILQKNLYGCDRSREALEITKLNLWLRTVQPNQPLISLEKHFKHGEFLKDDFDEKVQSAAAKGNLVVLN